MRLPLASLPRRSCALGARLRLWAGFVAFVTAWGGGAFAAPTPKGGCPPPANSLVINELQVGIGAKPRWLEILNPGKMPISLLNVVVRVQAKGLGVGAGDGPGVLEFSIGETVAELPPGEVLLVGHLPIEPGGKAPPGPWYGLKMIDLGVAFVLPVCDVQVQLLGPAGPIDAFQYTLCLDGAPPPGDAVWQSVLALDPQHADICSNDNIKVWCKPTSSVSPAKPTPGAANDACDLDGDGYTLTTGDCDDSSQLVSPIAVEVCNGKDDDCDNATDEGVVAQVGTCLGLGVCTGPLPDGSPIAVCDGKNGYVCNYPVGFESIHETLCDGFDNDCDGETDEGLQNACGTCGPLPVEVCNGKDDDCDGLTDETPDLSDVSCGGLGVCALSVAVCLDDAPSCSLPSSWQATETTCDGEDNDCDGQTDEELGLGQPCVAGTGRCAATGVLACAPDGKAGCVAVTGDPVAEICGNNQDDDCDGQTDEDFGVGEQCSIGLGVCKVYGKRVCRADGDGQPATSSVCLATPSQPDDVETCGNKLDDDCDGFTDEAGCTAAIASEGCQAASGRGDGAGGLPGLLVLLLAATAVLGRRVRLER